MVYYNKIMSSEMEEMVKTVRTVSDLNLQLPVIMIFQIKYCLMSKLKMMYLMIHLLKLSEKTINRSAVNKEYLKNNFLKRDKTGVYFDLRGYSIQNSEIYDPDSWNDKTITNKEYVDLRDNLKADKTDLDKKADLETSDEQTFKGIINVPDFYSGYSNMSNVMNKKYIDQKLDMKTTLTQKILSKILIPNFDDSDHSGSQAVNVRYVNNFFLNKKQVVVLIIQSLST